MGGSPSSGKARNTASIGKANPMPWVSRNTIELTPMTRPFSVISGPPLLPGLMGASVCRYLVSPSNRSPEKTHDVSV